MLVNRLIADWLPRITSQADAGGHDVLPSAITCCGSLLNIAVLWTPAKLKVDPTLWTLIDSLVAALADGRLQWKGRHRLFFANCAVIVLRVLLHRPDELGGLRPGNPPAPRAWRELLVRLAPFLSGARCDADDADDADAEEIEMLRGLGSQAVHAVLGKVHGLAEMIGVPGRASEDLLIGAISALKH